MKPFDLIVIGGGTGGLRAVSYAASQGKRVAVIEQKKLGGTCLLRGCIPSKILIYGADLIHEFKKAHAFGIKSKIKSDFVKAMKHQRDVIADAQRKVEKNLKAMKNVSVFMGTAEFVAKDKVKVGKNILQGKNICICTGTVPSIPPFVGIESIPYLTSDSVFAMKKKPKSVILVGGGYISVEFAYFFQSYGCNVTILNRSDGLVSVADQDISQTVEEQLSGFGVNIINSADIVSLKKSKGVIVAKYKQKRKTGSVAAEAIMVNTGRTPYPAPLRLDNAGIKTNKRGFIIVNDYLQTSNKRVFAFGDIIGRYQLAHTVKREAQIAVHNAFSAKKKKMDYSNIPYAVFTHPEIGSVGLTEQEAQEKGLKYDTLIAHFIQNGKAKIMLHPEGFVKVIYDTKTKKILGAHIIGVDAGNLIHEFAALRHCNATIDDLRNIVHIHPTLAEVNEFL